MYMSGIRDPPPRAFSLIFLAYSHNQISFLSFPIKSLSFESGVLNKTKTISTILMKSLEF